MRFHHMCVVTRNLDRQIAFWRDVMGFDLAVRLAIPDGEDFGLTVLAPRSLMRDTLGHPEAHATVALMTSKDGAMIELLAPEQPGVETSSPPPPALWFAARSSSRAASWSRSTT